MPVVDLTANARKEQADHCKAVGQDGYLTQPARVAALNETLSLWLGLPPRTELRAVAPPSADRALYEARSTLPA